MPNFYVCFKLIACASKRAKKASIFANEIEVECACISCTWRENTAQNTDRSYRIRRSVHRQRGKAEKNIEIMLVRRIYFFHLLKCSDCTFFSLSKHNNNQIHYGKVTASRAIKSNAGAWINDKASFATDYLCFFIFFNRTNIKSPGPFTLRLSAPLHRSIC